MSSSRLTPNIFIIILLTHSLWYTLHCCEYFYNWHLVLLNPFDLFQVGGKFSLGVVLKSYHLGICLLYLDLRLDLIAVFSCLNLKIFS